ncbi:glyceraldehyde-3-phosphate dehydrogenase, testis-specific [Capsella rubella]|uniref:glyceraldehyde-3-phosphate dehydrogenase, testis-specific n=1 Tax=Capsella rubella TaxID=81985 RepID=UPI000CD4B7D2|nr:glyceraldehyde-3-phosphate dehydrogenase, testis-specific [Capsella rubella]
MAERTRRPNDVVVTILVAIVILASPIIINAADSIKCTPCLPKPSPPPPPPSCPPPPSPPSPPPPKISYCPPSPLPPPPPPPPTYIYAYPPGNLYPIDRDFGAAAARESFKVVKLFVSGVMVFMIL